MESTKTIVALLTFLAFLSPLKGQEQYMPDSLIMEMKRTYNKERRLEILWEIVKETHESNPDTAIYYANEQQKLAKVLGNEEKFVRAIWARGIIHKLNGNLKEAVNCFFESLDLYRKMNRTEKIAIALYNIGQVIMEGKNFSNALLYFKEASNLNNERKDYQRVAKAQYEIARCYLEMANYNKSLFHLNQCLKMNKSSENQGLTSKAHNYLGINYYKLKEYDKAIMEYSKARRYAIGLADYDKKSAIAYNNIGEVYVEKKDYQKAWSNFNKALALKRKLGDQELLAGTLINLGKLALLENRPSEAISYLEEIISILDKDRLSDHLKEASILLSDAYKSKQDLTTKDLQKIMLLNKRYARHIHDLKQTSIQESMISTISKNELENVALHFKEKAKKTYYFTLWIIGLLIIIIATFLVLLRYKERKFKSFIQQMWKDIKDI